MAPAVRAIFIVATKKMLANMLGLVEILARLVTALFVAPLSTYALRISADTTLSTAAHPTSRSVRSCGRKSSEADSHVHQALVAINSGCSNTGVTAPQDGPFDLLALILGIL